MEKLKLIVEESDGGFLWGRVEDDRGNFIPTGGGETEDDLIKEMKMSIELYQEDLTEDEDPFWYSINVDFIEFDIEYDTSEE